MPIVHVIHLVFLSERTKTLLCCAILSIFLFFFNNTDSKMLLSGTHKMVFLSRLIDSPLELQALF